MNDYMNGRKGNEELLDPHIPRAHLTIALPALPSSAKGFVPRISGLGPSVSTRGESQLLCGLQKRHGARDLSCHELPV